MKNTIKNILITITSILSTIALIYILILACSYQCKIKAKKQNFEYDFGIIQGCMIKVNDNWVDYKKYRYFD